MTVLGFLAIKYAPTANSIEIPVIHVLLDSDTMHHACGSHLIPAHDHDLAEPNFG